MALNTDPMAQPDDIDNLGSRRLRFFDEMIAQKFRLGMLQMKRNDPAGLFRALEGMADQLYQPQAESGGAT